MKKIAYPKNSRVSDLTKLDSKTKVKIRLLVFLFARAES
jgi:hypothetical protein